MSQSGKSDDARKFVISSAFSPWPASMGGLAIGTVAVSRMYLWGKITGISGILAGVLSRPAPADLAARLAFGGGLVACGSGMKIADIGVFESTQNVGLLRAAAAGALVGFGAQLGNGCTSGHGICGIGRLSPRSLVATPMFMATASLTAILSSTSSKVTPSKFSNGGGTENLVKSPDPLLGLAAGAATVLISGIAAKQASAARTALFMQEFAMGSAFAVGLGVSGMTKPSKVIGFLDFTQPWDPSLAFVMAGALGVAGVGFRAVLSRKAPALAAAFSLPTRKDIDLPLVAGSGVFGIGWGLAGICPGPAMVNVGNGQVEPLVFVSTMLAGFKAQQLLRGAWVPVAAPLVAVAAVAATVAAENSSV